MVWVIETDKLSEFQTGITSSKASLVGEATPTVSIC